MATASGTRGCARIATCTESEQPRHSSAGVSGEPFRFFVFGDKITKEALIASSSADVGRPSTRCSSIVPDSHR